MGWTRNQDLTYPNILLSQGHMNTYNIKREALHIFHLGQSPKLVALPEPPHRLRLGLFGTQKVIFSKFLG